jgi:hypothetical protein
MVICFRIVQKGKQQKKKCQTLIDPAMAAAQDWQIDCVYSPIRCRLKDRFSAVADDMWIACNSALRRANG